MEKILVFLNHTKNLLKILLEVLFLLSLTGLVLYLLLGEESGLIPRQIAANFESLSQMLGPEGLTTVFVAAVFYVILNRFNLNKS